MDARARLPSLTLGRYVLFDEIASGGMAVIHLGRLSGAAGFSRAVAIKRLHAQFAREPAFVSMLVDEAWLAAKIGHPNVVSPTDVFAADDELFLVMEFVAGDSLAALAKAARAVGEALPVEIAVRILLDLLAGLGAAHTALDEHREPLGIVHRDVSPQNVLVGADGIARVLDFGIAKAKVRNQTTDEGQLKGKLGYMAPEQLLDGAITPRVDVYAASVVLWEALANRRLFRADTPRQTITQVLEGVVWPPSRFAPGIPPELDRVVLRGLERDADRRFESTQAMARELERALAPASAQDVAALVERFAGETITARMQRVREIEGGTMAPLTAGGDRGAADDTSTRVDRQPPWAGESPAGTAAPEQAPLAAATSEETETVIPELPARGSVAPSIAAPELPVPAGPGRGRAVFAAAVALLVVGGIALASYRGGAADAAAARDDEPVPSASAPAALAASGAAPAEATPASAEPQAASTATGAVPDESASAAAKRSGARSGAAHAPAKRKPANCNPPYVQGPDGFRHVKRECL